MNRDILHSLKGVSGIARVLRNYIDNSSSFSGLQDTPSGYLSHSGDYLIVNDNESGIHFTGIEKIASDLTDYGFSNEKVIPRQYPTLPPPLDHSGELISVDCNLYISCDGQWKSVESAAPPPEGVEVPDCVSNLEEYNQYEDYVDNVINSNIDIAFDIGFRDLTVDDFFNNVCLFANNLNVPEDLALLAQTSSNNVGSSSHGIDNHYPEAGSFDILSTTEKIIENSDLLYNDPSATITHSETQVDFWHTGGTFMGWVLPEEYIFVKTGQKFRVAMFAGADRTSGSTWSKVGHPSHPSSWTTDYIASASSNESGEITFQYSFYQLVSPAPDWHSTAIQLVAVFNYGTENASWYLMGGVTVANNTNRFVNIGGTRGLDFPYFDSPQYDPLPSPFAGLGSVLVTESNYKWALVPKDNPTVNIQADPNSCQFVGWQTSDSSIIGNTGEMNTTAFINNNTSITGVFDCTQ